MAVGLDRSEIQRLKNGLINLCFGHGSCKGCYLTFRDWIDMKPISRRKFHLVESPEECDFFLKNRNLAVTNMGDFLDALSAATGRDFYFLELYACTNLFNLNGDIHLSLKKKLIPFFSPQSIDQLLPEIKEIIHRCLNNLASNERCDLLSAYINKVSSFTIYRLLGLTEINDKDYQYHIKSLLRLTDFTLPLKLQDYYDLEEDAESLFRLIERDFKGNADGKNFYRFFLKKNEFSAEQIIAYTMVMLAAGISTQHTLSNMFLNLLGTEKNQRAALLRRWPKDEVIEKLLYTAGGVKSVFREIPVEAESDFKGTSAGDFMIIDIAEANRKMLEKECPFSKQKQYSATPNFAFGKGVHKCIGEYFSRVVLRESLFSFFEKFPDSYSVEETNKPFYTTSQNRRLFCFIQ